MRLLRWPITTKNKFTELLGDPNTNGTNHAPEGKPHAADPTTHTHETDASADGSTDNMYKDQYGSAESDSAVHPATSEDDIKKNPFYDLLSGNESSHTHHSTPDATSNPTGDEVTTIAAASGDTSDPNWTSFKYNDENAHISTKDWLGIEPSPPFYETEARHAWATDIGNRYGLDTEGLLYTNDYTAPQYQRINGDLRDPSAVLSPEQLHQLKKRDEFLTTLPNFEGTVYRGFKMDEAELIKILESGSFSDPAYLSTSKLDYVADSFMRKGELADGEVRAMYEIRNASGPDVGPISFAPHEAEVLMGRNSDFYITSYEKRYNPQEGKFEYYAILEPKQQN